MMVAEKTKLDWQYYAIYLIILWEAIHVPFIRLIKRSNSHFETCNVLTAFY